MTCFYCIKMGKSLDFDGVDIIKSQFNKYCPPVIIDKVQINRIIVSKKESNGNKGSYKYYFRHRFYGCIMPSPLYIKLPQLNAYAIYSDKNSKCMNVLVDDAKLL